MRIRETFRRSGEIRREKRMLAAATYNLAKILQCGSLDGVLFMPLRPMLFLAIMDHEEVIFIDGAASRSTIQLAWQNFQPGQRIRLAEPIPFEVAFYTPESLPIMQRLQSEFHRALVVSKEKQKRVSTGTVIPF
jgi:hypothetical protein